MNLRNDPAALTLAADAQSIDALHTQAKHDPRGAVRETARQFEALLLNQMLKSMRETVGKDGMFDSEQTRMATSLMDQQLAEVMSRRGIGLAEMLVRQLSPVTEATSSPLVSMPSPNPSGAPKVNSPAADPLVTAPLPATGEVKPHIRKFVEALGPEAQAASRESGIPARFLLGHAALESGWGQREIRGSDGTQSFNLFGIKASAGWQGATVDAVTTEYTHGVAHKKVETFRAYESYREAFRDYAQLLGSQARYAEALKNTQDARAYARELQSAGYASDPRFASKLASVIDGPSLRIALRA
ncbi:MAG: flagellar assembly peptidoglycan hydrolase FlgJ [Burkholderiales bacterium]